MLTDANGNARKWILAAVLAVASGAILAGVRFTAISGPIIQEIHPVKPGEFLQVELDVSRSTYIFGYRLPIVTTERRKIAGVDLRDYESGKLIGRYHDAGVKICPHCNGVGEVKHAD